MLTDFFERAAVWLAGNGDISEKYIALYAKAMEILFAIFVNLITSLLIGWLCGMWWHCILFLLAFIPLRSYAGGYHARGYVSCYLSSCVLLTGAMIIIKYVAAHKAWVGVLWIFAFLSSSVIFYLAPLADENKPLSEKETAVFKKRSRMVLVTEMIMAVVFYRMKMQYCYSIIMAVILCAFALVLHKWCKRG